VFTVKCEVSDDAAPRGGGRPAGFPRGAQHHQKLDNPGHRSKVRIGILEGIYFSFFANFAIYSFANIYFLIFLR